MSLTYRPEIDGLRGIAVVAVIFYHAEISIFGHDYFQGGFLGVDIFFVISGYLITSIIIKELETTGQFSFLHFYERRARRILPALFAVMLAFFPLAWLYLLPNAFEDFSKSILSSLAFGSNHYFHYSGTQYGAESGLLKPFLHTWSLSVEEQFYVIFPISLVICFKRFRTYLTSLIFIGIVISLGLSEWGTHNHPSYNFYVLPTRGWELLAGAILARLEIKLGGRSSNELLNRTLPFLGLVLITHSIFYYDNEMVHPSFYTLSPIAGVMLIIWFSNNGELITKILSSTVFVATGLISYSLYLWHYPIFAFARVTDFTSDSLLNIGSLCVIIIILSIGSYLFIERPIRNKNKVSLKTLLILLISSILVLVSANVYTIHREGFEYRMPKMLQAHYSNSEYRKIYQDGIPCHDRLGAEDFCTFNTTGEAGTIYLLGDSVTDAILSNLIERSISNNFQLIHMSYSGNMFLPGFVIKDIKTNKIIKTETVHEFRAKKLLASENNSYVIILADYHYYFLENQAYFDGDSIKFRDTDKIFVSKDIDFLDKRDRFQALNAKFKQTLLDLANNNKKVILLYPLPNAIRDIAKELMKEKYWEPEWDGNRWNTQRKLNRDHTKILIRSKLHTDFKYFLERNREIFELFDEISHNNIYKLYPHKLFCNTSVIGECLTHDEENIFYQDAVHPSVKGAEMINKLIMKKIRKIEGTTP